VEEMGEKKIEKALHETIQKRERQSKTIAIDDSGNAFSALLNFPVKSLYPSSSFTAECAENAEA